MKPHKLVLPASDGLDLHVTVWKSQLDTVKGVVLLAHDLGGFPGRFDTVGTKLARAGYSTWFLSARGHGKTAAGKFGHFADRDGWNIAVGDLITVAEEIERNHPATPLFLLGYGLGSWLARDFASCQGARLAGLISIGATGKISTSLRIGAKLERLLRGGRKPSRLFYRFMLDRLDHPAIPASKKLSWLTADGKVPKQMAREFVVTTACFDDILSGHQRIIKQRLIESIPKQLPVLFLSGKNDGISRGGPVAADAVIAFQKANIDDVRVKIYPDAGRDILHGNSHDAVMVDIIYWLDTRVSPIVGA